MVRSKLQKIKYVFHLCQERQRQGHLSAFRQILEIAWLQLTRGVGYSKYHFADMWHRDATWDYKTGFLSHRNFIKKVHEINERKYHGITQYKPFEKAFFQFFNINHAQYVGLLNEDLGVDSNKSPLQTAQDLEKLLALNVGEKICFKLIEGDGGKGFKAYEIFAREQNIYARHLSDKHEYTAKELFSLLTEETDEGWLLEKYIVQHPTMKALNPSSINTIRMYVFEDKTGKIKVLGSFLRIGGGGSLIDNTSGGGLVCRIDHKSGQLHQACRWTAELLFRPTHPDHGARIEGENIPFWEEAKALGKKTLLSLPGTRFVGLDVAITPEGPLIVEINVQPDSDGLSFVYIQTANIFNT